MSIGAFLGRTLARRKIRRRYRNEILLLDGHDPSRSDRPSSCHFTVERAASRFVGTLMQDLARDAGLTPIDLDSYHFELGTIQGWIETRGGPECALYRPRGYHYGPFRTSTDHLLARTDFRVLISLRDPRDVLVSLYHNYAFESARPRLASPTDLQEIERRMVTVRRQPLDAFVLDHAARGSHVRESLEAYCRHLEDPNVLVVRYEDMVTSFDAWLARIVAFFGFRPSRRLLRSVRRRADFTPSRGPGRGPKRQVLPGEHRRCLSPETVEALATAFGGLLPRLGYELDPRY